MKRHAAEGPDIFGALIPVRPGHEKPLRALLGGLDAGWRSPFADVPGTHLARLVVLRSFGSRAEPRRRLHPALLAFSAMVDGPVDAWLGKMCVNLGAEGDRVWSHCAGWPGPEAAACARWLLSLRLRMHASVIGNPGAPVDEVLGALDRREVLRTLALRRGSVSPADLRSAYEAAFGHPRVRG